MKVRVLKTDDRLGVKAGEEYEARRYSLDPDKMTLLARIPDGYNPMCNQYLHDLHYFMSGQWHELKGTRFVPIEEST